MQLAFHNAAKNTLLNLAANILKIEVEQNNLSSLTFYDLIYFIYEDKFLDLLSPLTKLQFGTVKSEAVLASLTYEDTDSIDLSHYNYSRQLYESFRAIMEGYNFSKDELIILCNIGDVIARNDEDLDREFIVRLPELIFHDLDSKYMENFAPMREFWQEYITPEVNKLRAKHDEICLKANKLVCEAGDTCSHNNNPFVTCIEDLYI